MIQFTQPWALLALLSLPIIVVLYALKPKRRTATVASIQLWKEVLRDQRKGLGVQKLLRDLSLILFLLIATALALSLANPSWIDTTSQYGDVVLVIDTSASMKARGNGTQNRFHEARRLAEQLIDELPEQSSLLIMTSARSATLRTAFENNRDALHQALRSINPTDEQGRPDDALTLAQSLLRNRTGTRLIFITDGAFDAPIKAVRANTQILKVGGTNYNVAIAQFRTRPELGFENRHQGLVTVKNYASIPVSTTLNIVVNEQSIFEESLSLAGNSTHRVVFSMQSKSTGLVTASLQHEDDLVTDNRGYAVLQPAKPISVLLLGAPNVFLDSALAAWPNLRTTRVQELPADWPDITQRHDVTIIDSLELPHLGPGNYLLINTLATGLALRSEGHIRQLKVDGQSNNPLVEGLDMSSIRIDKAMQLGRHDDENIEIQPLFWSNRSDLALAITRQQQRLVVLGFDLVDSNLPLHAAFPLFLSETIRWLHSASPDLATGVIHAGQSVMTINPGSSQAATMSTPGGDKIELRGGQGTHRFDQTDEVGFYQYESGPVRETFAVNLFSAEESNIDPRAIWPDLATTQDETNSLSYRSTPLWPALLLGAVILLMIEWSLWCWRGASA